MQKESSKVTYVPAPPPGILKKPELYALSIGQVIGAGVITLVGPAMALTGYSAWLAYGAAIIWGFLMIMPVVWVTSTLRLGGGYYSMLAGLANEKAAGMYAVAFLWQTMSISLFGVSLGVYANSLWPQLNPRIVGIVFLTLFYVINLGGVDIMAKAQKVMTWMLIAALLMFIIVGMTKLDTPVLQISSPDFIKHGGKGFIAAIFLFVYSTNGYSLTMNYGQDAHNAKRDIPWAILMSVPTLVILYCGVAIVAGGILPLEMVENQPLTLVARTALSPILFVVFMVGGPIMALMTTMNSSLAYNCVPIAQACTDGWLPRSLAKKNKRGSYYRILTIVYLIGLIPLLLNFSVTTITNNIMLINSSLSFLYAFAYYQLPKRYPEAWKKSRLHMPDRLYYVMVTISVIAYTCVFINSCLTLTPLITIANLIIIGGCFAFGFIRSKSPYVHIESSVWDD